MSTAVMVHPRPIAGYVSFAAGAVALLLVLVHFWAGPFAPRPHASVTIGEIAAQMHQAAVHKLSGKPPAAPAAVAWDSDRALKVVTGLVAALAIIASAAALVRRAAWQPAAAGVALGSSAIAFQVLTWAILVIAGCVILFAIIQQTDFFGS